MSFGAVWSGMAGEASSVLVRCGKDRSGSDRQGRWGKSRSDMVGFGMVGSGSRGMLGLCGVRFVKVWQAGTVLARLGAVGFGFNFLREM